METTFGQAVESKANAVNADADSFKTKIRDGVKSAQDVVKAGADAVRQQTDSVDQFVRCRTFCFERHNSR